MTEQYGSYEERVAALDSLEDACGSPSQYIAYLRGLALTYMSAETIQHHADQLHEGRRRIEAAREMARKLTAKHGIQS